MAGARLQLRVDRTNEWIAVHMTQIFGSMWATYLFFVYGFLPLVFPNDMVQLLYWSNTVQLWSLPLLMVGQNVMGRADARRSQETHDLAVRIDRVTGGVIAIVEHAMPAIRSLIEHVVEIDKEADQRADEERRWRDGVDQRLDRIEDLLTRREEG